MSVANGIATTRPYLDFETVVCDLFLGVYEFEIMPHGGYEAFPDVVSVGERVKTSKFWKVCNKT